MGLLDKLTLQGLSKIAAWGLFAPGSLSPDEMRAICATAFMRVPDHRQRAILEARPIYEQIDMHLAMARCGAPE